MHRPFASSYTAALVALALGFATSAQATSQRTFVAPTGSDANPCSIAQPCRSFGAAIAQTNAGGEVIVLESAGYGPVTITKAISIIAPPGIYAGISVASGNGVTVNAPGATVVLRGLTINGQGGSIGILLTDALLLRIERCEIAGMTSSGVSHATSANAQLTVVDTTLRNNASGLVIFAEGKVQLDRVRAESNAGDGLFVQAAMFELGVAVNDSVFSRNGGNGMHVEGTAGGRIFVRVDRSTFSANATDGVFVNSTGSNAGASLAVAHSAFDRNGSPAVKLVAPSPGFGTATIVDSTFSADGTAEMSASGDNALMTAARNNGVAHNVAFEQVNGGFFFTEGNNTLSGSISGSISTVPGI